MAGCYAGRGIAMQPPQTADPSAYATVLTPTGELMEATAAAERDRFIRALVAAEAGPVLLDLRGHQRIDHLGLRLVVGLARECGHAQRPLAVAVDSTYVLRVLQAMRLQRHLGILRCGQAA